LIKTWLGGWDSEDAVQDVFLRFWRAQQGAEGEFDTRFPNIRTVMGYLQRCAFAERFERSRAYKREQLLLERLRGDSRIDEILGIQRGPDPAETYLRDLLRGKLKTDYERIVFELSYEYGLAPRDIYAMHKDLFSSAQAVCRVKENLLKRLRRDAEIREWMGDGRR
jgi:DNA-directed RNA polymerase specialized sigma24 family protein